MAEETHTPESFDQFVSDDMSVMRELLHVVKGLSPTSMSPATAMVVDDENATEQFEFE